jgi:hypothetical protein
LQPQGLGRQCNILARPRPDPLYLLQSELQQINLASTALGLGTKLLKLRMCGTLFLPKN